MNLRITKHDEGFLVEVQESKWTLFGLKKYWEPCIAYSGSLFPFYFSTFEIAMKELLREVEKDVILKFIK